MDKKKNYFSPIRAWKYAFRKPVTISLADIIQKPRVSPENARGFHVNDWDKCIGCGTCGEICPTEAIVMVKRTDIKDEKGSHPERPTIDYGRCCFCALCVDICTTGSLNMTKEYVYNSRSVENYYLMPTDKTINNEQTGFGYIKTKDSDLLDLQRAEMAHEENASAKSSFIEIVKGFSREQAIIEASRCVGCEVCTKTCPANMHIPQYINSVWKENLGEGLELLYKTNPLPGVCGSVCTHKCESVCSLGIRGEPVAIRWLKRYIVDNAPEDMYESVLMSNVSKEGQGRIAVVGGGPSGMSASYYLRTLGYEVHLYEAKPLIGGVARYGVPSYRLPEERLNKDVDLLTKIGVNFHVNTNIGKDISLKQLKENYDAVFLSTGFPLSRSISIPNVEHPDVKYAMKFLAASRDYQRNVSEMPDIAEKVVVVGGGNVAFDVARTIIRLQNEKYGCSNVSLSALETRDIIPADMEEVTEGEEEGIKYYLGFGPKAIELEDGKIKGLKAVKCLAVFDETGRFNPKYDENQEILIEGTQVYISVGQMNEHTYFTEELLALIEMVRGKIIINEAGQVEGLPWLFAGGDIVHGPDMINAVADGHRAAQGIDKYLGEKS